MIHILCTYDQSPLHTKKKIQFYDLVVGRVESLFENFAIIQIAQWFDLVASQLNISRLQSPINSESRFSIGPACLPSWKTHGECGDQQLGEIFAANRWPSVRQKVASPSPHKTGVLSRCRSFAQALTREKRVGER